MHLCELLSRHNSLGHRVFKLMVYAMDFYLTATTEQIVSTLTRNRSLRKSLRESFRRLRSRSTAVRTDHTKSMIGNLSGSAGDKVGQPVEPVLSTV